LEVFDWLEDDLQGYLVWNFPERGLGLEDATTLGSSGSYILVYRASLLVCDKTRERERRRSYIGSIPILHVGRRKLQEDV